MIKSAYDLGVRRALLDVGLLKEAETDDPNLEAPEAVGENCSNPAEMLASVFQAAEQGTNKQSPDNRTKADHHDPTGRPVSWGKPVQGTGGEALERMVPGFNLPSVSSI